MTRITIVAAAGLALACWLSTTAAHAAARDRVFVASYGSDTNPCTFGSPCKTFQNAVNVVAAGGEVTAIDSAGFGTITIIHAVTITSPNGVEAGIAAPAVGGAAITINAEANDVVRLNGLTLDGDGVANTTGIQFNSGGSLNIQNSVIRNFTVVGLNFTPNGSSQLFVSNTLLSDNGADGISITPLTSSATASGILDHVQMINNANSGLILQSINAQTINFTVSDSVSANNATDGILAISNGGTINVMARNSTFANNSQNGLETDNFGATIRVTRSTITGNATAAWAASGVESGVVISYADNNIDSNGSNNSTPGSAIPYH